jgi:hypothetical protein
VSRDFSFGDSPGTGQRSRLITNRGSPGLLLLSTIPGTGRRCWTAAMKLIRLYVAVGYTSTGQPGLISPVFTYSTDSINPE